MWNVDAYVTCAECKYVYDGSDPDRVEAHRAFHEELLQGIPVEQSELTALESLRIDETGDPLIAVVTASSPPALVDLAARVARLPTRTDEAKTQFDGGDNDRAEHAHMFLALVDAHVVAFLVTRRRESRLRCGWKEASVIDGMVHVDEEEAEFRQPCRPVGEETWLPDQFHGIEYIWVHPRFRGRGIANALIEAAAHRWSTAPSALTWKLPFMSTAGATLAYRRSPSEFWAYR